MNIGKELRMSRLFRRDSKRMVLITIDHGICIDPMPEINDPAAIIRQVAAAGVDAVLLTPGIARLTYREFLNTDTSLT
jgi:class I fructose-bisphosphate aldolase